MKYLSKELHRNAYSVALCLDKAAFYNEMRILDIEKREVFLLHETHTRTHFYEHFEKQERYAYVCMDREHSLKISLSELISTLAHEAVHIFQWHCDVIGEKDPSREFEAYSIDEITKILFEDYLEQTGMENKLRRKEDVDKGRNRTSLSKRASKKTSSRSKLRNVFAKSRRTRIKKNSKTTKTMAK